MNTFCVNFLQNLNPNEIVTEEQKQAFRASVESLHEHGHYLAYSHARGWTASNKRPEMLEKQKREIDLLMEKTFVRQ